MLVCLSVALSPGFVSCLLKLRGEIGVNQRNHVLGASRLNYKKRCIECKVMSFVLSFFVPFRGDAIRAFIYVRPVSYRLHARAATNRVHACAHACVYACMRDAVLHGAANRTLIKAPTCLRNSEWGSNLLRKCQPRFYRGYLSGKSQ